MLTYSFADYPWLMLIDKIDGKDARLSDNEIRILCYFHSFYRKGQAIHPSKVQIAQALHIRLEEGQTQPSTIRRAIKGLQNKGYIHLVEKGNSKGKANCYEFCPGRTLWDLFQIVDKENPDAFSNKERELAKRSLPPHDKHTEPMKDKPVSERVPEKAGEGHGKKQKVDTYGWEVLTPEEIEKNKNRVRKKYRDVYERLKSGEQNQCYVDVEEIMKTLRGEEAEKCLKGEEVIKPDKWFNPPDDVLEFINELADKGFSVTIAGYWDGVLHKNGNPGETKFNLHVVKEEKSGNGIYIAHYDRGQK